MAARTGEPRPRVGGSLITAGAGLFAPAGAWMVRPVFGMMLTAVEVGIAVAMVATALYGSKRHSDRAFRLFPLAFDRAEPPPRRSADQDRRR
jgi:hypothetical protein